MDVVWEVSLETISEVLAQIEGRVEDANIPTPGAPDKVHEGLQCLLWAERDKHTKECTTLEMGMLCGRTRNLAAGKLLTFPFL